MAEPFIGQIIMAGFNFAPRGYATCDGQLMSIAQNTALFSLLGITYGGDGRVTFALPDLRGRTSMNQGQGPGLTGRVMGEAAGEENYTLISTEIPMHNHLLTGFQGEGDQPLPQGNTLAGSNQSGTSDFTNVAPNANLSPLAISATGGNQAHNNMEPYLVASFSIALEGIFPSRN